MKSIVFKKSNDKGLYKNKLTHLDAFSNRRMGRAERLSF